MKPAIVITAFNRPRSLERLLLAIANSKYIDEDITLIISIDYQDSLEHERVVIIANEFEWKFGRKDVIVREENLGLRNHILMCGDLTDQYQSIIMLEDDIMVSPFFYLYAKKALAYYGGDERIAGISLYNYQKYFQGRFPFELLADYSSDVYFLQIASSWGQAWTRKQWQDFRFWYGQGQRVTFDDPIPSFVASWPESSWLKYFIKYLVCHQKYFVYPKQSLTSNFGDAGVHNLSTDITFQVPTCYTFSEELRLVPFELAINVYDSFFELKDFIIKQLNPKLAQYEFIVDLYGAKDLSLYTADYAISRKAISGNFNRSFGLVQKPPAANVIENVSGNYFYLARKRNFNDQIQTVAITDLTEWKYFYGDTNIKTLGRILRNKMRDKLIRILRS